MAKTIRYWHITALFTLLFLAFTGLFSLYWGEEFPDHAFFVSAHNSAPNLLSYFFASLVYLVNYFFGSWSIIPLLTYAVFYSLFMVEREQKSDLLVLFLTFLFYFHFYSLFDFSMLGLAFQGIGETIPKFLHFILLAILVGSLYYLLIGKIPQFHWKPLKLPKFNVPNFDWKETFEAYKSKILPKKKETPLLETVETPEEIVEEFVEEPSFEDILEEKNQGIPEIIESKFEQFKISGKIVEHSEGPLVDTYEYSMNEGVKVSKILGMEDDLSLALGGPSIRIFREEGKSTIGIEIPKEGGEVPGLLDLLEHPKFLEDESYLPLMMGIDTRGNPVVRDLVEIPHLLMAGSTGSGKSVLLHSFIISLMSTCECEMVKFVLIDPKQVEFAMYHDSPFLHTPVLTDELSIGEVLNQLVEEMNHRYSILQENQVRELKGLFEKEDCEIPFLIVIIEEYASLMQGPQGKEMERLLSLLAAKGRASGIHLILSTQRPSVDVVTGVIRSNFPGRISLKMATAVDSRTVLDQNGAERLCGRGDMLLKIGSDVKRVHAPFLDEELQQEILKDLI